MATGRTNAKYTRVYINGYDLSGDTRTIGPLAMNNEVSEMEALNWEVKGALPTHTVISLGTLNALLNINGSNALHDLFNTPSSNYPVMVPVGIRAEPAQGDPVFCAYLNELAYTADFDLNTITISLNFGNKPASVSLDHKKPWGDLLHANSAVTAVNTATGIDGLAASAYGGFMMYQVFAGNGTATIKVQEADTNSNGSFSDLSGATTGSISCATPTAGIVQLSTTAAIKRYLRWQIALGTATTVTFALAFVRSQSHNV